MLLAPGSRLAQTEGVMGLSLATWVSLIVLCGFGLTLLRTVRSGNNRLHDEIALTRTELKGDMADLRTELKGDIADLRTELKGDIARLDDRVYALAVGLRPQVGEARAQGSATS